VVGRGRGIDRRGGLGGRRGVGLGLGVDGDTLVAHIGDVSVVVVGGVLDVLGPAVGQSNRVRAGHGTVGIGGLGGVEGGLGVVISNSVLVGVRLGDLLLLVVGGGGVVGGLGVDGGGVVRGGGGVVHDGSGVVSGGGGVVSGGGVVHDGSGVVSGGGVVDGSGVVGRGGVVDGSGVVGRGGVVSGGGGVGGDSGGSVHGGHGLLSVSVAVDGLGSGVGLAGDASVVGAVGLVHGVGDGGGVALLDGLVVGLVRGDDGQQSGADKCLNYKRLFKNWLFIK